MVNYREIREIIEKHDSIVIYRHIRGDYDALGSQLGLKHILQDNYPDKKVYTCGDEDIVNPDFLEAMDNPTEEIIASSLAIITDTSNIARVEHDTYRLAVDSIRIDHHPFTEQVAAHELIDTDASSASQLIMELAMANDWTVSEKAAGYLYAGISTDTLKMTISKVDSRLFHDLSVLMNSQIDINMVNRHVYDEPIDLYNCITALRTRIIFAGNFAYILLTQQDMKDIGIPVKNAKESVTILGNIKGVDKYATFTEDEDGTYTASLRSHSITISDIAVEYGGGGHLLASGISGITRQQVEEVIEKLIAKE